MQPRRQDVPYYPWPEVRSNVSLAVMRTVFAAATLLCALLLPIITLSNTFAHFSLFFRGIAHATVTSNLDAMQGIISSNIGLNKVTIVSTAAESDRVQVVFAIALEANRNKKSMERVTSKLKSKQFSDSVALQLENMVHKGRNTTNITVETTGEFKIVVPRTGPDYSTLTLGILTVALLLLVFVMYQVNKRIFQSSAKPLKAEAESPPPVYDASQGAIEIVFNAKAKEKRKIGKFAGESGTSNPLFKQKSPEVKVVFDTRGSVRDSTTG